MKFSTITAFTAFVAIVWTTPLSFTSREVSSLTIQNEGETGIERRVLQRAGINIYKTLAPNGGVKIVVTGMISATGELFDIFSEQSNKAMDLSLSAFSHLRQTMQAPFPADHVGIFRFAEWIGSYTGSDPISTAVLLDYKPRTDLPGLAHAMQQVDLDAAATSISSYFTGFGYAVTVTASTDATIFEGFPGAPTRRRSVDGSEVVARFNNDLQGQQMCATPMDVRRYFTNNVPAMTTDLIGC